MIRKALLVGLNHYPNPLNNLRGCVNDVLQSSSMLQQAYGFDDARQVRLLTDERATTKAIVDRLQWLVKGSRAGDVLVFHYSGHGSQVRDRHGDELDDNLDEIICPYDLDWDDPFTDDDMCDILEHVGQGANLTVILDCCHSGTGLRACMPGQVPLRVKWLPPPPDILHRTAPVIEDCGENRRVTMGAPQRELALRRFATKAAQRGAVLIAACRADQTSADAWIDGDYHGAFTYLFWRRAAQLGPKATYSELAAATKRALREAGYEQVPQLEGATELLDRPAFAAFDATGLGITV